jgi:hypothetical protein
MSPSTGLGRSVEVAPKARRNRGSLRRRVAARVGPHRRGFPLRRRRADPAARSGRDATTPPACSPGRAGRPVDGACRAKRAPTIGRWPRGGWHRSRPCRHVADRPSLSAADRLGRVGPDRARAVDRRDARLARGGLSRMAAADAQRTVPPVPRRHRCDRGQRRARSRAPARGRGGVDWEPARGARLSGTMFANRLARRSPMSRSAGARGSSRSSGSSPRAGCSASARMSMRCARAGSRSTAVGRAGRGARAELCADRCAAGGERRCAALDGKRPAQVARHSASGSLGWERGRVGLDITARFTGAPV